MASSQPHLGWGVDMGRQLADTALPYIRNCCSIVYYRLTVYGLKSVAEYVTVSAGAARKKSYAVTRHDGSL